MCGITGYWHPDRCDAAIAERMSVAIQARGPDSRGVWCDHKAGLALAHRRLAVLDLSPAGHQPMVSPCKRYALTYNGEIYNNLDIRRELECVGGYFDWRGHSDTETLLAALRHWGVPVALERLNGMFAFALWDARERLLYLARDRMGEKPLYYGHYGKAFLFGSELKALRAYSGWQGMIDRDALTLYLRHNYVPTPWSIYRGIAKLPPAHYVVIREGGRSIGKPRCYWSLATVAEAGTVEAGAAELTDELDALLTDAVKRRMASDVPLGAFLSGGYDSTMVTALMQAQSQRPVRTFSIGFHEAAYDESRHAKKVAAHLGTDHTELLVSPEQALAVVPKLPFIYDEPFADSSQIPTFLVSQLARRHVTVALSGDGGDELFCGYNRYVLGYQVWRFLQLLPNPLRRAIAAMFRRAPGHALDSLQRLLPRRLRVPQLADRLPKLADVLAHRNGPSFYRGLVSHAKQPDQIVIGAREPEGILARAGGFPQLADPREWMMLMDSVTYLPDDILTKVDRASMAVSLEARVPLLDHRVVEFALRLPIGYKFRKGQGKWLLRQVLDRYVPRPLMNRPKMGFGVPIEHWLRGPLRGWAEDLLNETRLRNDGFLDPQPIREMWREHQSGARRWHYHLWDVLMFQAWLRETGHH
ncbi:asparagine synthase (glutamine-hydrolyzing) [Thiorhodovibrio frisius]|uniref:asparagine synthase (glutamine-hydrolyzing) n=1 Tax=Thiorhodovibrio frisius TaxID=631362 RepID=H8Z1S7_9GAMM|nr:asparagine synthase (glutamine-hydrolyzing) [Thiorhodovibrio frisius]EIC22555.1 asparagine synthase, glutamine-hydrolyzing [Thiorhodovibrio frisius]WPL19996.1 Asparagine synthetase [glutamine-hydrolyzing] 1 [Thiorhodovibrio frisius]